MDFRRLSRRELQTLCKRNKIKANMTNIAMADALKSLQKIEDVDDILLTHQSQEEEQKQEKLQESRLKQTNLKDLMVKSPEVNRWQRTPSVRKSIIEQMEIDGMPLIFMGDGSSVHTNLRNNQLSEELASSEIHQFPPVDRASSSVETPTLKNTDENLIEVDIESIPSQNLMDKELIVGTETCDKIPSPSQLTLQKDPLSSDLLNVGDIIEGKNDSEEAAIGGTVPELSSVGVESTIEADGNGEVPDHLNLCDVGIRESNEEIKIGEGCCYPSPYKIPVNFSNHVRAEKSIDDEFFNEVSEREVCSNSSSQVQITVNESDVTSKFAEKQEASDENVSNEWQRIAAQQSSSTSSAKILEGQASPDVIEESDGVMDLSAISDDIVNPIRIEEYGRNRNPVGIEESSDLTNPVGTEESTYIKQYLKQNMINPTMMKLKNMSLGQLRKVYRKKLISLKTENNTGVSHDLGIKQINASHKDEIFPTTTTTTTTVTAAATTTTTTASTTTKTIDDLPSTPISRNPDNSSSMNLRKLGSFYKKVSESNIDSYDGARKPQSNKEVSPAKTVSTVTTTTTTTVITIADNDASLTGITESTSSGYRDMSLRKLKSCYKNNVSASKTDIDDKSASECAKVKAESNMNLRITEQH